MTKKPQGFVIYRLWNKKKQLISFLLTLAEREPDPEEKLEPDPDLDCTYIPLEPEDGSDIDNCPEFEDIPELEDCPQPENLSASEL